MVNNLFVGAWRLISYEIRCSDGRVLYPFGPDAEGYIIYSDDGHMSVAFMRGNRPIFTSKTFEEGTTEEKASAADAYQSYCGTYEIQREHVIHHVEISLFPNLRGIDLKRRFAFEGNRLILSTRPGVVDGIEQAPYLVWELV